MPKRYPFTHQHDAMDCGPACLRMVAKFHGKNYSLQYLRDNCFLTREGVSLLGISDAAEKIGFRTIGVKVTFEQLCNDAPLPCIVHWKQNHFVVVYDIKLKKRGRVDKAGEIDKIDEVEKVGKMGEMGKVDKAVEVGNTTSPISPTSTASTIFPTLKGYVTVADPGHGIIKYTVEEFLAGWISSKNDGEEKGIALLLEPTPDFYEALDEKTDKTKFSFIFKYLRPYKKYIAQLGLGLLLGSLLQLVFPFLTQSIVDYGISNQNLSFVTLILVAQLVLFTSQTVVEFIRSWILLHISTRINISIISDFLIKLMKLPIGFFDTKMIGDIMQRIGDHSRIQNFLTSSTLNTLFSFFNLIIFSIVLCVYNLKIFAIFLITSVLYVVWVTIFLKRRRNLDFKRFAQASAEQSNLFQMITGMQEIKLNNCERQKRWEWENIQARLYKVSIKGLALSQYQQAGAFFINEGKNIVISYFAAAAVISGDMTLGMMMAVQYIIGQLNAPVSQLIGFIQSAQDAKISMERLGEIHNKDDEEQVEGQYVAFFPEDRSLYVNHLSFQYEGPHSEMVLQDINLVIPENKTTAIVGMSGSGKTTLVKLLLDFYPPAKGEVRVGDVNLKNVSHRAWRDKCGAVMQDGFIFSDTIAKNIAVGDESIDTQRLFHAAKIANIQDLMENLPLGYNTKIGQEGHGLSQGQKQRILIARAVYKNPEYLFFDEATNSLDANNERVIMENLEQFFQGRTVVVVAHRLSTVKNADNIVVLEKGKVVEQGSHKELTALRGVYYNLVKNQLELGN